MSDFEVCPVGTLQRLAAAEVERDALKAAEARCKALEAALADRVVSQTMLTNLAMQDGSLYASIEGGAAGLLAAGFGELLHQHPEATNYLEMSFRVAGKPVIVTVQKGDRPTPHTLRREAEGQRDAILSALKGVMYWDNGKSEWQDARAAIDAAMKGGGNG